MSLPDTNIKERISVSHYHHLSISERETLWELRLLGKSIHHIAHTLSRSPSTISRELKRNSYQKKYSPSNAQSKYLKRRKKCRRPKLLYRTSLTEIVRKLLIDLQWSPEQISHRLFLEKNIRISVITIYRALNAGIMERKYERYKTKGRYPLQKHLRRKNRPKGGNRGIHYTASAMSIRNRPREANDRLEFGHLEGDTVYSSFAKTYILTLVDRRSRYLWTGCCYSTKQEETASVMIEILRELPKGMLKSITLDQGTEFRGHGIVTRAIPEAVFYFADPKSPWQRGTNENTNGLLRQYVPKHTYKRPFSQELLREFTYKLNHRPRKCLNWRTPYEVLFDEVLHLT